MSQCMSSLQWEQAAASCLLLLLPLLLQRGLEPGVAPWVEKPQTRLLSEVESKGLCCQPWPLSILVPTGVKGGG